jgi:hypothetical protein
MEFRLTVEHKKIRETSRRVATDFAARTAQHDRDTLAPLENYIAHEAVYGITARTNTKKGVSDDN